MEQGRSAATWVLVLVLVLGLGAAACGRWSFDPEPLGIPTPHRELQIADDLVPPTTEALLGFPLLVDLEHEQLRSLDGGGAVADLGAADVVFYAIDPDVCDGAAPCMLASEVELYDRVLGRLVAWVRVPRLAAGVATQVFMTFQHPAAIDRSAEVWDPGFVAIWHLADDPPAAVRDSTLPRSDGTAHASMIGASRTVGCKIGRCLRFDGVSSVVNLGSPDELRLTGAMTLEGWMLADAITNTHLIGKMAEDTNRGWDLSLDDEPPSTGYVMYRMSEDGRVMHYATDWQRITPGSWYHVAGVFSPGEALQFFLDGVLVYEQTTEIPLATWDTAAMATLGGRVDIASDLFGGLLDEIRISNVPRSSAWILAGYRNAVDPARYVQFSPD